jgi:hypothetical protein
MVGPAAGRQPLDGAVQIGDGVDGEDRAGRAMVGHQNERWGAEIDGGHVGPEGIEAPPEPGVR